MRNKEKNFLSAVVYLHNAQDRAGEFMQMLIAVLEQSFEHSEIICVNDSSTDCSVDQVKKAAKEAVSTSVSIVNMSHFHGLESAMAAGDDLTIGDFVLEFDSTYIDYRPDEIMNIYYKALEGYDIVSAVPDKKQRISSNVFYHVLAHYSMSSGRFVTERFRVLSRRVLNRIDSMTKTIPYRKAVYMNAGLKMEIIRYEATDALGKNIEDKNEKHYRRDLAVDALILFTNVGYRFSSGMTVLMMVFAFIMAIYSICIYVSSTPIAGWTTTVLFLSGAFFGLFGILTIIIRYLQILVNLVFRRKQYSFESIEKITQ